MQFKVRKELHFELGKGFQNGVKGQSVVETRTTHTLTPLSIPLVGYKVTSLPISLLN